MSMLKRSLLALSFAAAIAAPDARAAGSSKPEPSVTYATSWAAAVREAKLMNVPIVVHSHGFY